MKPSSELRQGPFREDAFPSPAHDSRNAAVLGIALAVTFGTCFVTGLYSHLAQHPPGWFTLPARPAGLYRVTQGVHVASGLASIPLLLAKLWVVFPKLFAWPPFTNLAHLVERICILPLIAGGLFLCFTGLANINVWYPWPFSFPVAHYWAAWMTIGALVVHVGAKWSTTRAALAADGGDTAVAPLGNVQDPVDRRRFLTAVFATSGLVTLFTAGQTVRPLARLALLAPRRPDNGPQGFPINRTARRAGVTERARAADFRLAVIGRVSTPLSLKLEDLGAMPQHDATLPIACVEGWSTSERWTGVRVRDLLERAGAGPHVAVRVESLETHGNYRTSDLNHWQAHDRDTLLALQVNGEPLALDHGYPLRLIGPDRPGVMQTKWVTRLVVQ